MFEQVQSSQKVRLPSSLDLGLKRHEGCLGAGVKCSLLTVHCFPRGAISEPSFSADESFVAAINLNQRERTRVSPSPSKIRYINHERRALRSRGIDPELLHKSLRFNLGIFVPIEAIPFFWVKIFPISVRHVEISELGTVENTCHVIDEIVNFVLMSKKRKSVKGKYRGQEKTRHKIKFIVGQNI